MAFVAANMTNEPRAFSIGPIKIQLLSFSAASADVAGTATADKLSSIIMAHVDTLELTAAPTFSGNVITLAFTDPGATVHGNIIVFGK